MAGSLPLVCDADLERLDRHAERRSQSLPTVSVLSGGLDFAVQTWRCWASARRLPVVQTTSISPQSVVSCWAETLDHHRNLAADAVRFLASRLGCDQGELSSSWMTKTVRDAEDFWEAAPLDMVHDPIVLACRWLTLQQAAGEQLVPERVADALHRFFRAEASPGRVLAALAGLLPSDVLPSLLLVCPGSLPGATDWLGAAGTLVAEVLGVAPRLH